MEVSVLMTHLEKKKTLNGSKVYQKLEKFFAHVVDQLGVCTKPQLKKILSQECHQFITVEMGPNELA